LARTLSEAISEVRKKLRGVEKQVRSKANMTEAGEQLVKDVKKRVILGFGVEKARAAAKKFAALSKSYKFARKTIFGSGGHYTAYKTKEGKIVQFELNKPISPGEYAKPSLSNLNLTSKMIKDLKYRVTTKNIFLTFKTMLSKKKAKWAHDGSSNRPKREFLHASKAEYKTMERFFKQKLREVLAKLFR